MNSFDILAIAYYVCFGFFAIFLIGFIINSELNKSRLINSTPIKFKEFKEWYTVAPNKYILENTHAFRKDCKISIVFNNPVDAIQYWHFTNKMKKSKNSSS